MIRKPRAPINLPQKDQVLGVQAVTGQSPGEGDGEKISGLAIQPRWANGPRTPAWDELWRRILADVLHGLNHSVIDAVGEPDSE